MQILLTSYIYLSPHIIFLSSFIGNFFGKVPWLVDSDLIALHASILTMYTKNAEIQYCSMSANILLFRQSQIPKCWYLASAPITRSTCTLFLAAAHVVVMKIIFACMIWTQQNAQPCFLPHLAVTHCVLFPTKCSEIMQRIHVILSALPGVYTKYAPKALPQQINVILHHHTW
jgi:hypothetical protein